LGEKQHPLLGECRENQAGRSETGIMLPAVLFDDWLKNALREDLGTGDITTEILVPAGLWGRAEILAKETAVVAGLEVACRVFRLLDEAVVCRFLVSDGMTVAPGRILSVVEGPLRALLCGERVALNLLQHLSGVATLTQRYVQEVAGTGVKILDTRKTLPGLRILEKYAVRVGGGVSHRASLSEGVLIKENHLRACGGIRQAVEAVRALCPQLREVEVEVTNAAETKEALEAGVSRILLDNMTLDDLRSMVSLVRGRATLEVSGGVGLENVRCIADTGVDLISVGRISHSAPGVDLSMLVRDVWDPSSK